MGPKRFISARSGGLPASMAATNFCSRSPKVAQSSSTSTFRSWPQVSMCFASTSLPAVTKLLKSHTRSLGLAWAPAIVRRTPRPAAVPPVTTAALRRNSRRAIKPAASCSERSRRRLSMTSSFGGWKELLPRCYPSGRSGSKTPRGPLSAGDHRFRDPEIQHGALEAAQILAHAGELSRGFVRDEGNEIPVIRDAVEQVGLERLQGAGVLDRQLVEALGDLPLQVIHVEGQLVDEHVRTAQGIEHVRAPVDMVHHLAERADSREVGQVGSRADADRGQAVRRLDAVLQQRRGGKPFAETLLRGDAIELLGERLRRQLPLLELPELQVLVLPRGRADGLG